MSGEISGILARTRKLRVSVLVEKIAGGKRKHVVSWFECGRRHRQYFDRKSDAEEAAALRRGEEAAVLDEIRQHGLTLRSVWEHYLEQRGPKIVQQGPTIGSVLDEMLRQKVAMNRSQHYIESLSSACRQFCQGREAARVTSITTSDIEEWLALKNPSSRSTFRARISTLFAFAIRRSYLLDNPCARVEVARHAPQPIRFLSVRQTARCLVFLRRRHPQSLAAFVLTCLAGLRPEEACKTSWTSISLEDQAHIIVEAQTSKVRQRRIVYPLPAAVGWLKVALEVGSVLPLNRQAWRKTLGKLRNILGFEVWTQDITRHTAATYWMAHVENSYEVAEQLGNSPAMLKTHYRALVTRAEAGRFWGLVPRLGRPTGARLRGRQTSHGE